MKKVKHNMDVGTVTITVPFYFGLYEALRKLDRQLMICEGIRNTKI